ncbi:patatin-like phospholipase family protein [Sphingopyxis sp. H115]|uniref:patatin-like phospholipase family protein n=1 Tax=Sphingopyxis sp. H115 TaxID=1759073 RepID=UPI000736212D|nr:patatin-like phospholipase family protein [Sphingopyxis sp. H115]KTE01032.1 hypothetical protein ATE71_20805 [Sphingopyxis sp. H115]
MKKSTVLASAALAMLLGGCASLGLKSVPWPTSTGLYDREAVEFLRGAPAVGTEPGPDLHPKPMADDGRLVGLVVSGGGARATSFTLGVLEGLQEVGQASGTDALARVDFISSNSGGSWGVAAWLAQSARADAPFDLHAEGPRIRAELVDLSKDTVPCWYRAMRRAPFGAVTLREIYPAGRRHPLPRVFFNASMLPAQSPFVFTQDFVDHYQVESVGACSDEPNVPIRAIGDMPLAFAASTSGSVPGFYHAYAQTRLCDAAGSARPASFCHPNQKGRARSWLRLADGGLYDNIGYKTAFEVMAAARADTRYSSRGLIIINTNPTLDEKTIVPAKKSSSYVKSIAINGFFAVQDSTFERLYKPMFAAVGAETPVLLDFYSTAGFDEADAVHLRGLKYLAYYAAHNVSCYRGDVKYKAKRRKFPPDSQMPTVEASIEALKDLGGDCLSENFYRTGTLGKTTYKIDPVLARVFWELGILAVRMNSAKIKAATGLT